MAEPGLDGLDVCARASADICDAVRPEYQDVVNDLATALLAVADASEREREFRERLNDGGVNSPLI